MAQSRYSKKLRRIRSVATAAAVGGGKVRIPLKRDSLIDELRINMAVSQAHTNAPTSVDVRDFIANVALVTSSGRRIECTGAQAYDLAKFTGSAGGIKSVLAAGGASTCRYGWELHLSNSQAIMDMATALRANELDTLDLLIEFAPDTANGFKGGSVPLVTSYDVDVEEIAYDMLGDKQHGGLLGMYEHHIETKTANGTTVGKQKAFDLTVGNSTRFVTLHAYDTTGAAPVLSDAIIGDVVLNIGGKEFRTTTMEHIQSDNANERGYSSVGVGIIDFGDDELGFLHLVGVAQAEISWTTKAGAPATYRVDLAQDFTSKKNG